MPEADAEHGYPPDEVADRVDRVRHLGRVAWSVGVEDAARRQREHLGPDRERFAVRSIYIDERRTERGEQLHANSQMPRGARSAMRSRNAIERAPRPRTAFVDKRQFVQQRDHFDREFLCERIVALRRKRPAERRAQIVEPFTHTRMPTVGVGLLGACFGRHVALQQAGEIARVIERDGAPLAVVVELLQCVRASGFE